MASKLLKLAAAQRRAGGGAAAARLFGAHAPAVAEGSPFMRFSNPMPQQLDYTPLLSSLPETKARARRDERVMQRALALLLRRCAAIPPPPAPARRAAGVLTRTLLAPQVTVLPNGMRVATETIPFAETATVGMWINSGSRFETDATNGTAHFLEHLLFKGTKARARREL